MVRWICLTAVIAACSGNPGPGTDACGFADDLLPFAADYSWSYRVTDLASGVRTSKTQWLESQPTHADYGEVLKQVTEKATGRTESLLSRDGERILRFEQIDYDVTGAMERTTYYDPYRIRIDESLAVGATLSESYVATIVTPGMPDKVTAITDEWEVIADDVGCVAPMGEFRCRQIRRVRTVGGVAAKDFLFSRGVGKVIEDGSTQLEELDGCGMR